MSLLDVPASSFDLLRRLVTVGELLVEDRRVQMSDATIRELREEIDGDLARISEGPRLIGYEAVCLIVCLAEIAYARSEHDQTRESRAICYCGPLLTFMRRDLRRAEAERGSA